MKIGLIGCGAIAKHGHLPALKTIDGVEVVAVADTNLEAAKRAAKKFKIARHYSDFHPMLSAEDVDTIVITTPTTTHATIAIEAAKAGKNIIIEKPLAMNLSECYAIRKAVKENNVLLSIIQNYRYFSSMKIAKDRLSRGYFGKTVSFYGVSQTRFPSSWTTGTWLYHERGVLLDFTPHLSDALQWLMNTKASSVYAVGGDFTKSSGFLNYANILVKLENGVSGFLETGWLTNSFAFYLDIKGTGGLLKADVNRDNCEEIYGSQLPVDDAKRFTKYMLKVCSEAVSGVIFSRAMNAYKLVYADIASGFEKDMAPIPIEDGIRALSLLEAAYISIKEQRIVELKELSEEGLYR